MTEPLRILQVIPAYYPAVRYGGPIRSVHALSAALVSRGHDVTVYTTSVDGEDDLSVPLDRAVTIDGVKVRYFRVPALRRLCWCPTMSACLAQTVRDFDVVHLQSVFLWPTLAGARAACNAGVPYLMSPRGMLGRDVIRRKSRWVKSLWIALIERASLARAAGIHVTAQLESDEIAALGLPMPDVFCVPNGVAWPEPHRPLSEGPHRDIAHPYALFLSRISWKKGLDRLIEAWRRVPDLKLIIAGNDNEGYSPTLTQLIARAGVTDRVSVIGAVSDEHKWALYENAEMFVLPSYSENFGNVVAEAMAMSCPVIVSAAVGLAELVRARSCGIVTNAAPDDLAAAVNALHGDPVRRRALGDAGRRAAIDALSWSAVARSMEQAYRSVLNAPPRPALEWRREES